jgi:hypothetical protein
VAIVSHIAGEPWVDGPADAERRLMAVGLSTPWSMLLPYSRLSAGERARADVARTLKHGAVVDDFASGLDPLTARATSLGVARYVRECGLEGVVLASCHDRVAEWLRPDWILEAGSGHIVTDSDWPEPAPPRAVWAGGQPADKGPAPAGLLRTRDLEQRQRQALLPGGSLSTRALGGEARGAPMLSGTGLTLDIERAHHEVYDDQLSDLHYKTEPINSSARVYAATLRERGGIPVALLALLPQPGRCGS